VRSGDLSQFLSELQITAGLRVKLSDAGKEYLKIWDREKGTHYLDEGVGTVVASGRYAYLGLCDGNLDRLFQNCA